MGGRSRRLKHRLTEKAGRAVREAKDDGCDRAVEQQVVHPTSRRLDLGGDSIRRRRAPRPQLGSRVPRGGRPAVRQLVDSPAAGEPRLHARARSSSVVVTLMERVRADALGSNTPPRARFVLRPRCVDDILDGSDWRGARRPPPSAAPLLIDPGSPRNQRGGWVFWAGGGSTTTPSNCQTCRGEPRRIRRPRSV